MSWSPRHNHLRFAVENDEGQAIVRLAGELDFASAAVAHLALERAGPHLAEITLDLSRVVFLDASGVRFLISAQRRARAARRRMVIRRPSRSVRRMLELTGVRSLLIVDDRECRRAETPAEAQLTQMLDSAIQLARRIAHADRSTAQLLDPTTGDLRIVAQHGFHSAFLDYIELVNDIEPLYGTLRRGRSVWVPDLARSPLLADTPELGWLLDAGVRATASIPVNLDGELIAGLSLYHHAPTEWTAEKQLELERLGRSVAQRYTDTLRLTFPVTATAAV
jgi:anti-anti-sigma factor